MNLFTRVITASLCFSALNGLIACKPETDVDAIPSLPNEFAQQSTNGNRTPDKPHRLIKHGTNTLSYNPEGQLSRVTFSPTRFIDYTYQDSIRVFTSEYINNVLEEKVTYNIHHALGAGGNGMWSPTDPETYFSHYPNQCYLVVWVKYIHGVGAETTKQHSRLFRYNEKGMLWKVDDFGNSIDVYRSEITYDSNGDLAKVTEFTAGDVKMSETTYTYSGYRNSSLVLNDYHTFNPDEFQVDPYVPVFGKYGSHLIQTKTRTSFFSIIPSYSYRYQYTLDASGYVTNRDTYNVSNSLLVQTTPYVYLPTLISL